MYFSGLAGVKPSGRSVFPGRTGEPLYHPLDARRVLATSREGLLSVASPQFSTIFCREAVSPALDVVNVDGPLLDPSGDGDSRGLSRFRAERRHLLAMPGDTTPRDGDR